MHSNWNVEISQVWWPESEMPFFRLNNCSSTINWVRLCRNILRSYVIIAAITFRVVIGSKQTFQSGSWRGRRCRRRGRVPGGRLPRFDVAKCLPKLVGHGVASIARQRSFIHRARQRNFSTRIFVKIFSATCATSCEACRAIREGFPFRKTRHWQFVKTRWSTCNNQRWEPMSHCWMSNVIQFCIKTSWLWISFIYLVLVTLDLRKIGETETAERLFKGNLQSENGTGVKRQWSCKRLNHAGAVEFEVYRAMMTTNDDIIYNP